MRGKQKPKDWKITKFLKEKAPHILDKVGDVLPDKGALGIIKNLITNDKELSKEDKDIILKEIEIYLEDVKDARDLQKVALQQDDVFSKRFIYYLAAFVSVSALIVLVMLFFVEIPEENKRIVDMVTGIFIGTGFIQVLNFFFGSSKGSKDKHEVLHKNNNN